MNGQIDMQDFIDMIRDIARQEIKSAMRDVEKVNYGTIISANANGTFNVEVAGGDNIYNNIMNKTNGALSVGDSVLLKSKNGNLGNGYIAIKMGV